MSTSTDIDVAVADAEEAPIVVRQREAIDAEMDITPMIDCVFLLLIFFIVCSTMDEQSPIELANARHGKAVGERESVVISIGEGGVDSAPVYLSDGTVGEPLPTDPQQQRERIVKFIEEERAKEAKNDILIKADRNVAHRDVAQVIKAVSQVEGVNLHLAVAETD
jgi:biopolymer transport protein ExbD